MADSFSRREFLGTTTATVAAANSAPAAGFARLREQLTDRDFWYLHNSTIAGSDCKRASGSPTRYGTDRPGLRRRFQPLPNDDRYRILIGEWQDERMSFELEEITEENCDSRDRDPVSWVDTPWLEDQGSEAGIGCQRWYTRPAGLARVAEINRLRTHRVRN